MSEIDWKTKVYHALPGVAKNMLATLRGCQLEYLRKGPDFGQQVEMALTRDTWSSQEWLQWQKDRVKEMLVWAAREIPYYRDYWQCRGGHERADVSELNSWPILEKQTVREQPHAFLADSSDKRRLHVWHTSGSTGTPTKIWWSKEMMRRRWAIFEARSRRWYGVEDGDAFALVGGRMVTPVQQKEPPFWVWNAASNQLYMSSYHLSKDNIPYYVSEMTRRKICHIYAYTSSIYEIATVVIEKGLQPPPIKVVVTQAEPCYDHHREVIEKAFGCSVRTSYGMAEMLAQASECEFGNLHLWPEYGVCEIDDGSGNLTCSGTGDLVMTGLLNYDMPLIRYCVGDRGTLASPEKTCPCGRGLPIVENVEGRIDDVLLTRDGRMVGRLSTAFKNLPIVEVQTIQRSIDHILLKVVPDRQFDDSSKRALIQSVQERMGDVEVEVELLATIPRGPNGKFRTVVCEIDDR